jgi:NAD-reducing hydrogenase large subunit
VNTTKATRKIVIEPVTRVEGHGKVTILLDEENRVQQARLHIVEFRGFERFIQGRPFWEVPVLVQRLCGICPVSHHLAAAKAVDRIVGGEDLPPTALKMRLLMHHGQFLQSHALHFFHLCSPDLLFGFGADVNQRHVLAVAAEYPELATQGILMRKYGQEIIRATAGKKIHGTGAIPGGINKNLSIEERDSFLKDLPQIRDWARSALALARDYTRQNLEMLAPFGSFDSNHLSIVRPDGAYDIYDGGLRARNAQGELIFDHVENQDYTEYIAEEVRPWSYMKFPFIQSLGPQEGWYRVGPLARLNNCDSFDTPEAEAARKDFKSLTQDRPNNVTMAYHWARMIEVLHSVEKIGELLEDPDLQGTELSTQGKRRHEAVGIIEAPRGTLIHHYVVDDDDLIVKANLIVATTHNNEPMNRAVQRVAEDHLSGVPEITDGLLNHVEVAIRAYDPCLSCATHAMGRMPLIVELASTDGRTVERRVRE